MKAGFRTSAQAAVLRAVHGHPGMTRAQAAAEIGIPSGFAAETVARLVATGLIAERPALAGDAEPGSAALVITRRNRDPSGRLVSVGIHSHPADRYAITMEL